MALPKNTESISISIPSWLVEELDDYCQRNDFNRSALISRALRKYLLLKKDSPDLWERLYNHEKNNHLME